MKYLLSVFAVLVLCCAAFAQSSKTLASNFSVTTIDGKNFTADNLRGKVIVLNLWYVNCPFCVEEIQLLNGIVDQYKNNKDVVFLGLATDDKSKLEAFLKKNPFRYNIVAKSSMTILSFGEPNKNGEINIPFPMHVVIDREGKVVARANGKKGVDVVRDELKKQLK
jgi:peroxiredoxin